MLFIFSPTVVLEEVVEAMLFDDVGAVFSDDVGTVLSKLTTSASEFKI